MKQFIKYALATIRFSSLQNVSYACSLLKSVYIVLVTMFIDQSI